MHLALYIEGDNKKIIDFLNNLSHEDCSSKVIDII